MKQNHFKLSLIDIIRRGHYFYHLYYYIYTKVMDNRIAGLTLDGTLPNKSHKAYPCQCITYPYLKELLPHLDLKGDDVFIDVGCAWGRLLGYLAEKSYTNKLIGIELNKSVADFAKNALAKYNNVEIIRGNILKNLPTNGTVFYLFNPFNEDIMKLFLDKLEKELNHPVKLIYLHPTCRNVIDIRTNKWKLSYETKLKPKHLGELTLCVFESLKDI